MSDYARDLLAGDRAAVAGRYSSNGSYAVGHKPKQLDTPQQIALRYASPGWQAPSAFEWIDLSYEQLGPACLVTGGFTWSSSGATMAYAYTVILVHEQGGVRIRLEHENALTSSGR